MAAKKTKAPNAAPATKTKAAKGTKAVGKTKASTKKKEGEPKLLSRKERLNLLIKTVQKKEGAGALRFANEADCSYLLRRPCGITSLDIAMAGGFPASAPSVIVGPDGVGKDYLLWKTAAETQRLYGEDFAMVAYLTEFMADKLYMRNICGLRVGLSEKEILELDIARQRNGKPPLTKEERVDLADQVGDILFVEEENADKAFDIMMDAIESNVFQLAMINSIGFLQTAAKEDVDSFSEFAQQRNEAQLLSKFMPKLSNVLNRLDDSCGRNETSLIMVDQVRAKDNAPRPMRGRPVQEKDGYKTARNAWALKHGKAIEVFLHKNSRIYDEVTKTYLGREIGWELSKGKLGTHDGLRGAYNYFYDMGVDFIDDLLSVCLANGVLELNSSWVSYSHDKLGFQVQGKEPVRRLMQENQELVNDLRHACFRHHGIFYRHI